VLQYPIAVMSGAKVLLVNDNRRLNVINVKREQSHKIRVMIVDDTDIVRKGLSIALETFDDMLLVGEAANGKEAVDMVSHLRPDIILMDLIMPVMDGVQATEIIAKAYQNTKVVVLTSTTDMDMIQAALDKGAASYLLKNLSLDELENAIHLAYAS
jgi:two-component system, NarL family, response regulator LiaR